MYHYWKRCVLVLARILLTPFVPSLLSLLSLPSLLLHKILEGKEKERKGKERKGKEMFTFLQGGRDFRN